MTVYTKLTECVVCRHKRVAVIDTAQEVGEDEIKIAQRFGVTKIALRKHILHKAHESIQGPPSPPPTNVVPIRPSIDAFKRTPDEVKKAARERCLALVTKVEQLIEQVVLDEDASYSDKAKLLSAGQRLIESLGRFTGEIGAAVEINLVESPKWKRVESAIAEALAPYPEAAASVAKVLEMLEVA